MDYSNFSNPDGQYGNKGSVPVDGFNPFPSKSEVKKYFKELLIKIIKKAVEEIKNAVSIDSKIYIYQKTVNLIKEYYLHNLTPDINHPAIKIFLNFVNNKNHVEIFFAPGKHYEMEKVLIKDILKMKEVISIVESAKFSDAGTNKKFGRNIGAGGDQAFIDSVFEDLEKNPTHFLLGSYNGSVDFIEYAGIGILINIKISNTLGWESATRLPGILGGYKERKSIIPNITGWETLMNFEVQFRKFWDRDGQPRIITPFY